MPALLTSRSIRPCFDDDLVGGLLDGLRGADIERDCLGRSALSGDLGDHPSRASLRRPETTTVQPSAASASAPASPIPLPPPVTQATRFPFLVMQTVSVAFWGVFANPALGFPALIAPFEGMLHEPSANANLFSRLFDGLDDPKRLAIETLTAAASAMAT